MSPSRIAALVLPARHREPPRPSLIVPSVALYHRILGGHFEAVYGETVNGDKVIFYVTENATNLSVNMVATRLWHSLNRAANLPLFGNAVVVGADGCEDSDLPHDVANLALAIHLDLEMASRRIYVP